MLLLYIKGIKLNIIRLKIPNIVVDSVIEQVEQEWKKSIRIKIPECERNIGYEINKTENIFPSRLCLKMKNKIFNNY